MKNAFLGFGITFCAIISIVIVMTLCGTNMRQNELNRSVDIALYGTVDTQFDEKTSFASSNDEFIAEFINALLVQINSDCSVKINVLDVDYQKGLLSVEVIEKFKHPIGKEGQVSVKRTVMMEQYTVPVS